MVLKIGLWMSVYMSNTPQKQKLATFTYIGTETRIITNLFKNTNIHIAYRTKKKTQYNTTYNKRITVQTYTTWAAYTKWTAKIANSNTLGKQVETSEHVHAIRTNNPNSKYAQHILDA
jgi:hypothetical protein